MFTFWKFFEWVFDGENILENKQEGLEVVGASRALFWSFKWEGMWTHRSGMRGGEEADLSHLKDNVYRND